MQRKTFRILIAVCAIWAALSLPSLIAVLYASIKSDQQIFDLSMATIGFAILPVACLGLWHERLWGFVCLLLGLVCVSIVNPTAIYLHCVCFAVTLVRYFFPRNEACTAVGQVTHQ